ncbi:hypothetical protein [Pararhodobacter sp.]
MLFDARGLWLGKMERPLSDTGIDLADEERASPADLRGTFVLHSVLVTVEDIRSMLEARGLGGFSQSSALDVAVQETEGPILVFIDAPNVALAVRLDAGEDPDDAFDAWEAEAGALLRGQRRARKRVTFVDVEGLASRGAEVWQRLADRLSARLTDPSASTPLTLRLPSPGAQVIAQALIAAQVDRGETAAEISSATIGARDELPPAMIVEALRQMAEVARLSAALNEAQATAAQQTREIDLLREGAQLTGEALEEAARKIAALEGELLKTQLQRAEVARLEQRLALSTQQHGLTRAILAKQVLRDGARLGAMRRAEGVQAETLRELEHELDSLREKLDATTALLEEYRVTNEAYSAELTRVYGSRSWRVTGPLRAVRHHMSKGD